MLLEFDPIDFDRYGDGRHIRKIVKLSVFDMTAEEIITLVEEMKREIISTLNIPDKYFEEL